MLSQIRVVRLVRIFRMIRVLRVMKLVRYLESFKRIVWVVGQSMRLNKFCSKKKR